MKIPFFNVLKSTASITASPKQARINKRGLANAPAT